MIKSCNIFTYRARVGVEVLNINNNKYKKQNLITAHAVRIVNVWHEIFYV